MTAGCDVQFFDNTNDGSVVEMDRESLRNSACCVAGCLLSNMKRHDRLI